MLFRQANIRAPPPVASRMLGLTETTVVLSKEVVVQASSKKGKAPRPKSAAPDERVQRW